MAYLLKNGRVDGNTLTVTGKTLGENLERWTHEHGELSPTQDVIRPLSNPIKSTGHIRFVAFLFHPYHSSAWFFTSQML